MWPIIVWLFVVGAAVGSFLNVAVYRLPLGISLAYPPSHCPKCGKLIHWYDNVPIFGWIALRGRCRQCHNPISARYPIVEAVTATMFAAVAVVDIDQIKTLYPYHMLLLCTLLCAVLIAYDGNRPPVRLFVPALLVGAVAPFFWRPMPSGLFVGWQGACLIAVGTAALETLAWLLGRLSPRAQVPAMMLLGIAALGWIFVTAAH